MLIVADAGPLLSFARAGRLDLLRDVVGTLTIPQAVYEEIVVRGAGKPDADAVRQAAWITRETVTDRTFIDQLPSKLNLGEREALALAREHGGVVLVDEREARGAAQQHGIEHFGSLRVLKEAKDREILHEVKPVLDELIATGTYISDTLYRSFLDNMGEEETLPERDLC